METVNYWAILVGTILYIILGFVWYGPLFGKRWMAIIGVNPKDKKVIADMQKSARPLYIVQVVFTLFQILVLAHLIADTQLVGGVERALWICFAFVIPTLATGVMWNKGTKSIKWTQFLIQDGYQVLMFVIYGTLLQLWQV